MLISSLLKTANPHINSRTNTSGIIDYIISSPTIYNNIKNLTLNNDLSSGRSAILFDFSTNINKSIRLPFQVRLYPKADRVLARSYLMTLYVVFPIHVNFPIRSRCVLKAIVHIKKTVDCFTLLEKVFVFFKKTLVMILYRHVVFD